ncbi:MAG: lytic transglycosylase domain-containing protein [Candidatus Aminicenantes bacterium]|nr:MAG: lytic transglycosylase domain-containing protein [Candidatus Aminicenantes bacterium]
MNLKRIYRALFLVLTVSTVLLTVTIADLAKQEGENQETISKLTQNAAHLEEKVTYYEKEKEKIEFYRFRENVFNLRDPDFSRVAKIVFKKSKKYGFNPYLIMAVIQVESGFDQYAVSPVGAYGLMQVNYSVWKDELNIDFNRIFEKEYNIDLGLTILKHYYEEASGNMFLALFRYNNGYKYQNKQYNGKIIATEFYSHSKKKPKAENKDKELSI